MTNEIFSLILIGAAWIRAVLGGSLEVSLWFTEPYFVQRNFCLTEGIIFSLGNCWWSPSELANSAYRGVSISASLCQCYTSIKVIKWHPLFTGNTKRRFIANKKCKSLLTQLGNGLFLLLSLLGKKKCDYLLSCRVYSNPIQYILSAAFIFSIPLCVTYLHSYSCYSLLPVL